MTLTAGNAVLEDAGLFRGDVVQRRPKLGHVILADAGDGGHFGLNDVGAVQPPAQTRLHDGDIDLVVGKIFECDGGQHVEVGRHRAGMRVTIGSTCRTRRAKSAWRDHLAIDDDAFADIDQVRAGVKADLVAAGLEHGRDHGASAALAFGSGNVDRTELVLRIAQFL